MLQGALAGLAAGGLYADLYTTQFASQGMRPDHPAVAAAAAASIRYLKASSAERQTQQRQVAKTKQVLSGLGLPIMDTVTHIVPVMVGDAEACKAASDRLLEKHGIYIQPINYPTVARGTERLRITPGPFHSDAHINALGAALVEVWTALRLPLEPKVQAAE